MKHLHEVLSVLELYDVAISLFKSFIFGLLIATISCYHGLRVKTSITEVPQMTTVAVMQSLFMVIIFNGIITVASYI